MCSQVKGECDEVLYGVPSGSMLSVYKGRPDRRSGRQVYDESVYCLIMT